MEISEGQLRHLTSAVDEQHHAAAHSLNDELGELHFGSTLRQRATARRDVLKKAVAGAGVLTIGQLVAPSSRWLPSWWGGVASAADAGPTTTAAAAKKALTDKDICAFARSLEYAAVASYQAALTIDMPGKLKTQSVIDTATQFSTHHLDHASAFGDLISLASDRNLGNAATHANPQLFKDVAGQLRAADTEMSLLAVLYELEVAAAGTYLLAIGLLENATVVAQTSSILPIESEHAAVLGQILGYGTTALDKLIPDYEKIDAAVDPTGKYALVDSIETSSAKDPK